MTTKMPSKESLIGFETELEDLRIKTLADLGEKDAKHIKKIITQQRVAEIAGRVFFAVWNFPTILVSWNNIIISF
jgi:hypothetical protein